MKTAVHIVALLTAMLLVQAASAEPTRDSLVAAWEEHVRGLPGTTSFEKTAADTYRYADTDLPYDGELKILGALVRSADSPAFESEFTHLGMVEFELADLPEERRTSQVYYYWLTDRQTLHYHAGMQQWLDSTAYRDSFTDLYPDAPSFGMLSFMVSYGIWIVLAIVLISAFIAVGRQTKKAHALMDDSASINNLARENLDRAEKMQDEVLAISRESRDLHKETNELLRQMLDALKR